MKLQLLPAGIASAAAGLVLVLGAHDARAGAGVVGPTTVHGFTAQIKGAYQDENKAGDDQIRRVSANVKDIAESCLDSSLAKTQKIVLVTDCGDATSNEVKAWVLVVDTAEEPAGIDALLGLANLVRVAETDDKSGDPSQVEYALEAGFECNDTEPDQTYLPVGFAKVSMKRLDRTDSDSPICANSASGKALGTGEHGGVVVESFGFNAAGRSKKITVSAADLNFFLSHLEITQ